MTYESYRLIFIYGLIGFFIMLSVTLVLFFLLGIPRVVGDLSGHTAKRAIHNIRQRSENGEHRAQRSGFTQGRSKLTDRITKSGNIVSARAGGEAVPTAMPAWGQAEETGVLCEETALLNENTVPGECPSFEIEYEITYIHSDEIVTGVL